MHIGADPCTGVVWMLTAAPLRGLEGASKRFGVTTVRPCFGGWWRAKQAAALGAATLDEPIGTSGVPLHGDPQMVGRAGAFDDRS